ncbi:hypothetical protein [Streptomyces niveus]|uniref:hypothetical protein n=1 Tax=Streptomyces niveus TaxID=193462 RepID=UPI00344E05B6
MAKALRAARDKAVAEAINHAERVVDDVGDETVPRTYGALTVQIRSVALAKLWQRVYAPTNAIDRGPVGEREQINRALQRAAEAQETADSRVADADVEPLIRAVWQVEDEAYREFTAAVASLTKPLMPLTPEN